MSSAQQAKVFEIKDFEFKDLGETEALEQGVSEEECPTRSTAQDRPHPKKYEVKEFLGHKREQIRQLGPVIKKERLYAQGTQFNVSPIVEHQRGMKEQEQREYDEKVKQSIEEKFDKCKEQAYQEGWEKGRHEGFESVQAELKEKVKLQVEEFARHIEEVREEYEDLLTSQKYKIYELVKTLTKWVILRELKDDGKYLERLLKKLILELNSKSNLLLKVGRQNVERVPEILEVFESQFEHVKNTRVEVIQDKDAPSEKGMILESENGILDGTLKTQFRSLDKLFSELNAYD